MYRLPEPPTIAVIGLGYVGMPLLAALSRKFRTVGFDIDPARIEALKAGHDHTGEVDMAALAGRAIALTAAPADMAPAHIFIVTVPTPIDGDNAPDLGAVEAACRTVGAVLARPDSAEQALVVLESTVYPGVTEGVCGPIVERLSGRQQGKTLFLGYSPERVNPGDRVHTVEGIVKVVAGDTPETAAALKHVYGSAVPAGIFVARDIRTAEAAKAIENAQRDVNIAFVNEVAMIFGRAGLSIYDVLDAAQTKWNFLPFKPGLVGGHCIGVDPYYLAKFAIDHGHKPEAILAGRRINDSMGPYVASRVDELLRQQGGRATPAKILVLGLTFKEDVRDLRNTKVVDVVRTLRDRGHRVDVHDPHADAGEAGREYGLALAATVEAGAPYGGIVAAVPHAEYRSWDAARIAALTEPAALIFDLKGMWRGRAMPAGRHYATL